MLFRKSRTVGYRRTFNWSLQAQEVILRVCHSGGPCSITGLSVWDMWWTKWHWDGFFFEYLDFPLSVSFHQSSVLIRVSSTLFNHLNAELNPICHLLALLGAHHILHVSRIRVNLSSWQGLCTRHSNITNIKINLFICPTNAQN